MTTVCYEIVPSAVFVALGEYFVPGRTYYVSPGTYESILVDGSKLSSKCKSAKPLTSHPG
jgi:hypothetical protein